MPEAPEDRIRLQLLVLSERVAARPLGSALTLTREPGPEGSFALRDKLSGPFVFTDEAFGVLYALDNSRERCQPIYLLLETRPDALSEWMLEHRAVFTCNECTFDPDACTVSVTPVADDDYRPLLENWETEVNILACPAARRVTTARLQVLATGIRIEFERTDKTIEPDELAKDEGWARFLENKAWIDNVGRSEDIILFRYRQDNFPMQPPTISGEGYTVIDRSQQGWIPLFNTINSTANTITYVKAPEISGFRPYVIGSYGNWTNQYGDQLLLLEPSATTPPGYIEVTGSGGASSGGGACGPGLLNVRRTNRRDNCKRLFWRFGQFRFTRGIPLLDALYYVLQKTLPADRLDLLPPTPAQLSDFFSAPTNPATGATQVANETPRLLLSAASDVKRYGASEPATKLLITAKQLLEDLAAMYDVGWFQDPATGWLRLEHRATTEAASPQAPVDLRAFATADGQPVRLSARYSYTADKLPRAQQLTIASAVSEDAATGLNWAKDEIRYDSPCVTTREGQNVSTRSAARLTGDVAGLALSGDALPDSALAVLAPDLQGELSDANRAASATLLLRRYHRHGAVLSSGTLAGVPFVAASTRPGKRQEGLAVPMCSLRAVVPGVRFVTNLGPDAVLEKAVLDYSSGLVTLSVLLPVPQPAAAGPVLARSAFNDAFPASFG